MAHADELAATTETVSMIKSIDFSRAVLQTKYAENVFVGRRIRMSRRSRSGMALVLAIVLALALPSFTSAAVTQIADAPDQFNEPNLIGVNPYPNNLSPSVLETVYGESNLRRVDDGSDIAFRHTGMAATVKAVARFNNPSIEDRLRFFNPVTDFSRVIHGFSRVPPAGLFPVGYNPAAQFSNPIAIAESGPVFELGLSSGRRSNPIRNTVYQDMMVTFEIIGNAGHPNNQIGNYVVGWEAFPNDDLDFQDVVYEISGAVPVPEPASLFIGGIAFACVSCARRRRS
jgi:hypothetical protein